MAADRESLRKAMEDFIAHAREGNEAVRKLNDALAKLNEAIEKRKAR
jgi:hypothetical protein